MMMPMMIPVAHNPLKDPKTAEKFREELAAHGHSEEDIEKIFESFNNVVEAGSTPRGKQLAFALGIAIALLLAVFVLSV